MTAFRDRLTPPPPAPLTPDEHYYAADKLTAELTAMPVHELALPLGKKKILLADLHARLAQCVLPQTVTDPDDCQF